VDDLRRSVRRAVRSSFVRAQIARARIGLADAALASARAALEIASKREAAGDTSLLDVNLARGLVARAAAAVRSSSAEHVEALGALRALLGVEPGVALDLRGDLAVAPLDAVDAADDDDARPDVKVLEAAIAQAKADADLGDAEAWPDVEAIGGAAIDDTEPLFSAGVRVSLPVFQRGQGTSSEARARLRRLEGQREARLRVARAEIDVARASFDERKRALDELDALARAAADENRALVRKAYAAGEASFADVIAVEREAAALTLERLDLVQAALEARFSVEEAIGVWK
jgi:cobalt-zinc-cadmium efflux system outer membrane protein